MSGGSAYRQAVPYQVQASRQRTKRPLINYPRRGFGPVRRWLPSWRVMLGIILFPIGIAAGLFFGAWYFTQIPDNLDTVNAQITTIYYNDGVTPIGTLAKERRILVSLTDLPEYVGNAVVASEDQTFWINKGVDLRAIARALYNNLSGGPRQGASTLTQQYVERYYTDTVTDYVGKAQEAIMALKVSDEQPKEQILEGYLNTIYWGRGAYGIEAASQMYFGHPAAELTYSEAAMLAGIIPSPSRWDPAKDEKTARLRFDRTIRLMAEGGFITEEQADAAQFPAYLPPPNLTGGNDGQAGYLMNEVVRELSRSGPFADNPEQITTRGLNIVTTINKELQAEAELIADEIPREGADAASPTLQMALVSIDPTNGEYVALYGGKNYAEVQFNFATDGRAQAGSTFKPFTLIAALEEGHQLNEVFNGNSGIEIPGWNSPTNLRNYGNISYGDIDLIQATANSVNTVFAQLNIEIGPEHTTDVAHQLGIPNITDSSSAGYIADNAANVLGTASVRPVDLAHAYATIAGGGYEVTPHIVREVTSLTGELLYEGPRNRVLRVDPAIIDATTYALQQVVNSGSGKTALQVKGPNGEFRPIAGKTGTANENIAAWFVGYTPQLVTVVGLHQDTPDGKGEEPITPFGKWREITGSSFPVTAWTEFMKVALADVPVEPFHSYVPPLPQMPEGCFIDEFDELVCLEEGEEVTENPEPTPSPTPTIPDLDYVVVPSGLVGGSRANAEAALAAVGLSASVSEQERADVAEGTVISVSSEGQLVPPGSIISVVVAKAPATPPPPVETTPPVEPPPTETPSPGPTEPSEPTNPVEPEDPAIPDA